MNSIFTVPQHDENINTKLEGVIVCVVVFVGVLVGFIVLVTVGVLVFVGVIVFVTVKVGVTVGVGVGVGVSTKQSLQFIYSVLALTIVFGQHSQEPEFITLKQSIIDVAELDMDISLLLLQLLYDSKLPPTAIKLLSVFNVVL